MKTNKLWLAALSAVGLLLASCGGGNNSSTPTPGSSGSTPSSGSQPSTSSTATEEKIELSAPKTTIAVDETVQITSSVDGVTYSSRDESVASVSASGLVTGLKAGSTTITARKTGYKLGSLTITVTKAPMKEAQGILEFEFADHYDPDGVWGYPQWGIGPGDSPIEDVESASGGQSVGWFNQGCKETIKFTSSKAGNIDMGFIMAYNAEVALEGNITIAVNGTALATSGKSVAGPSDDDTNNYYDWNEVMFKDVAVKSGDNEIVVECVGSGVNMDCVRLYGEGFTFEQIKILPMPKLNVTSGPISIYPEETSQIVVEEAGVAYASEDAAVATVSNTGLVTGVAPGKTNILITKEGYKDATVAVTVNEPLPSGTYELTLEFENGEHYAPDGVWGYPQWGMSYDTPVEEHPGEASGDKSIGWFNTGCKETLTFTAEKAGAVAMSFMMAYASEMALVNVVTIKVNDSLLDLTDKVVEAGGNNVYTNWKPVNFTNVAVKAGENTIVVEAIGNGPNMDCVKLVAEEDLGLAEKGYVPLPKINVEQAALTVEAGKTVQIVADVEGVSYASENSEIATVSETGLVTGVAVGKTNIIVSKEGFKDAKIEISVTEATPEADFVYLFEMEDAEHFIEGGIWGFPQWGMSYDTPVEDHPGAASGDKSVGWFNTGAKETLKLNASTAGTVTLSFMMATANNMNLANVITITVNGTALDLTGKVLEGGGNNVYTAWKMINFSNVAIPAGDFEIVIEAIGNGPNMDCLKVYSNTEIGLSWQA